MSDQWDAALVCKIEPIFGAGSTVDRSAVQTYRKQNDQLTPYKLVFTGTAAECQRVVAGLEAGTFTLRDMRQPDFELPPAPEQADPVQTAPDVPAPPEQPDEALYLLDDSVYLHIQASDGGWDYTLYTKHDMAQLNGGQLDSPGLSITDVVEHIRRTEEIGTLAVDLAPMEVLEELREHFTQEDAVQPDTTLDDYPMPDSSMTLDGLAELGY